MSSLAGLVNYSDEDDSSSSGDEQQGKLAVKSVFYSYCINVI